MRKTSTILLRALTKYFPILSNIYVLLSIVLDKHSIDISNYIYDIFGGSIYMGLVCLMGSFTFNLCKWHKILCISIILAYLLEWIDLNLCIIPNIIYLLQLIFFVSAILALLAHMYDKYKQIIRLPKRFGLYRRNRKGMQHER